MQDTVISISNNISNIKFEDLISYCIFPNSFIRNGKIPAQQRLLFEILCTFDHIQKDGTRKGWCDPSLTTLADHMGLSVRSTQIHLKRLVEAGMVTVIYRNNVIDGKRSSIYILNILPGISKADRMRIAATRNIEIKNAISGLNIIKIQTTKGIQNISEDEFDLEYLVTGTHTHNADNIMEGEIADPEDIISKEEEQIDDTEDIIKTPPRKTIHVKSTIKKAERTNKQINDIEDNEIHISFKKSPRINLNKVKPNTLNEDWNSDDVVKRIKAGNFNDLKYYDYCKYFKDKYETVYKGELLITNKIKDPVAIKNVLKDVEPSVLIKLIDYFIENYQRLFYNSDYRRPQIYQLGIKWILNKLLENYYYSEKAKEDIQTEPEVDVQSHDISDEKRKLF